MIFTAQTQDLQAALKIAGRVIPAKSPWPILQNIKIVTNDSKITVIGSDGDMTFETQVAANVETEGVACIPFDALGKFVSAVKSDDIKISVTDDMAKITSGRNRIGLMCAKAEDYPNYRAVEGDLVSFDAATLSLALRYCVAAASEEEARYYLRGVSFDQEDADLNLWGTNGHIASRAVLAGVPAVGGGGIMPTEAVQIILTISQKADAIHLNVNAQGWSAAVGQTRVWGKVVDGSFPDMRRMLTQFKKWTDAAIIDMDRINHGLSVSSVGSLAMSDKTNKIIIKSQGNDTVIFKGGNPAGGVGEAGRAEVDAEVKAEFAFALNAKYLAAALTGVSPDSSLTVRSANGAGMQIEPSQSSAVAQLTSVILPMRVSVEELDNV